LDLAEESEFKNQAQVRGATRPEDK